MPTRPPHRPRTWLAALVTCVLVSLVAPAGAQEALLEGTQQDNLSASAERLHKHAVALYKQGDVDGAVTEWIAAERVQPAFKYAFNIALARAGQSRWLDAWDALERADARAFDESERRPLERLRTRVEDELLATHAKLVLRVQPPEAEVKRNGRVWEAPRRMWTEQTGSDVTVTHPGHAPLSQRWEHPTGSRHALDLRLDLVRLEQPSESSGAAWGWVSLGAGVVLVGGGATLLALGVGEDDALAELNAAPLKAGPSYAAYITEYKDTEERRDAMIGGGAALAGAGLALTTIGVILLVAQGDDDDPEDTAWVAHPMALRGGGGGAFTLAF